MPKPTLTDAERLILANQHEILAALNPDNSEWNLRLAANLRDGHKWLYEQDLQLASVLPDEDVEHVLSILGIFSDLKDSYERLDDKGGIDASQLRFPGFDGNNESELLHFAQALSNHGNYHLTIGKHAVNSHMPTTELYKRMRAEWERLGKPSFPYSKEMIVAIVASRTHPSMR